MVLTATPDRPTRHAPSDTSRGSHAAEGARWSLPAGPGGGRYYYEATTLLTLLIVNREDIVPGEVVLLRESL